MYEEGGHHYICHFHMQLQRHAHFDERKQYYLMEYQ